MSRHKPRATSTPTMLRLEPPRSLPFSFFCCVRNVDGNLQSVVAKCLYKEGLLPSSIHDAACARIFQRKQSENEEFVVLVRERNQIEEEQ